MDGLILDQTPNNFSLPFPFTRGISLLNNTHDQTRCHAQRPVTFSIRWFDIHETNARDGTVMSFIPVKGLSKKLTIVIHVHDLNSQGFLSFFHFWKRWHVRHEQATLFTALQLTFIMHFINELLKDVALS